MTSYCGLLQLLVAAVVVITTSCARNEDVFDEKSFPSNDMMEDSGMTVSVSDDGQVTVNGQERSDLNDETLTPIDLPQHHHHHRHHQGHHGPHGPHRGGRHRGHMHMHDGPTSGTGRMHHRRGNCPRRQDWAAMQNMTVDEQLASTCERWEMMRGSMMSMMTDDGGSSDVVIPRHMTRMLRRLNPDARETVMNMMRRRHDDLNTCCSMVDEDERLECIRQKKMERFERVCRGEEPICPWALMHSAAAATASVDQPPQSNLTVTCCSLQGPERLKCFLDGIAAYKQGRHNAMTQSRSASMDGDVQLSQIGYNDRQRGRRGRRMHHRRRHHRMKRY